MFKSKKTVAVQVAIVIVTVAFAVLAPRYIAVVKVAENWASDWRLTWIGTNAEQHPDIVLVSITEQTLEKLPYRSPVDRGFLADVLQTLAAKGVRAVGFDILFDQPTESAKDTRFRDTVAAMSFPVVLGWAEHDNGLTEQQYAFQSAYLEGLKAGYSILAKDTNDGTVRFLFPGRQTANGYRQSFAGMLAEALGKEAPRKELRIVYRGRPDAGKHSFRSFPADVIGVLPPQWFAGKVALVGADLPMTDRHRTPFVAGLGAHAGSLPGVEIHAHILTQLMEGKLSKGFDPRIEGAVALVLALVAIFLVFLEQPLATRLAGGALALVALGVGNGLLYSEAGISAPLVAPAVAFGLATGLGSTWGAAQGRQIRKAFGHFLAPALVKQLADEGRMPKQGGELREITVWISDLENYTTLSEIYSPTELVRLLNSVYTVMGDTVEDHGGFVAQFVGDAMVAGFGAPMDDPDHARKGVESALACQDRVAELQATMTLPQGLRLHNRIGISTGKLLAGNIGSKRRLSYTILGDDINLASRLEGVNKIYGSSVLVNEVTALGCGNGIRFREVDVVRVKGRNAPVRIMEPLGPSQSISAETEDDLALFVEALAVFRRRRFAEAADMFGRIAERDPVAESFVARCAEMEADPPAEDWDGVNTLLTK